MPIGLKGFQKGNKTKSQFKLGYKGMVGRHHTEKTKKKLSLAHKGIRLGCHHSEETRKKMSLSGCGKYIRTEKHKKAISIANTGRKRTDEIKKKLSLAQKAIGNKPPKWWLGPNAAEIKARRKETYKNIIISQETRDKISKALRGKYVGELSSNWKNGSTRRNKMPYISLEYTKWKRAIFTRDDYTCVRCGKRGGDLEAHHIKSFAKYPELRYDTANGETLCKPYHKNTDNYGYKNPNRNKLGRFMPIIIRSV